MFSLDISSTILSGVGKNSTKYSHRWVLIFNNIYIRRTKIFKIYVGRVKLLLQEFTGLPETAMTNRCLKICVLVCRYLILLGTSYTYEHIHTLKTKIIKFSVAEVVDSLEFVVGSDYEVF